MSPHDFTRENLDAYLAGGLTPAERSDVEQHTAGCPECARTLADTRKLEQTMADLFTEVRPDADLETRALARLRKARIRRASILRFVTAAAAVLVLGIVGAAVQAIAIGGPMTSWRQDLADHRSYFGVAKIVVDKSESMQIEDTKARNNLLFGHVHHGPNVDGGRPFAKEDLAVDEEIKYSNKRVEDVSVAGLTDLKQPIVAGGGSMGPPSGENGKLGKALAGVPADPANVDLRGLGATYYSPVRTEGLKEAGLAATRLPFELPNNDLKSKDNYYSLGVQAKNEPKKTPPQVPAAAKPNNGAGFGFGGEKPPEKKSGAQPASEKIEPMSDAGRKIIRTGDMEFEVNSFDAAVDAINKLLANPKFKGGFSPTTNSDKLPNGKKRGSVVVRMPPQLLDPFIRELRSLPELGDLRTMRITSQEVTKQYTDAESELKAARAVETRLIEIIKTGKGEIKDLVAAERELGTWRVRIEKLEGEKRYFDNQVALSTLTISLTEKEIQAAAALVVDAKIQMRIEVEVVKAAREAAEKAVKDLGGRLVKSDEKQHPAGQVEAFVHADIPPDKKEAFRQVVEKLGIVSAFEAAQTQTAEGGSGKAINPQQRINDVRFELTLINVANIRPKHAVEMQLAATDVPARYAALREEIVRVKGQIRDGKVNEQDKLKVTAVLDFNVPSDQKAAIDKKIAEIGPVLKKSNTQAAVTDIATEQKFGYVVQLFSVATIPPREMVKLEIEVDDVEKKASDLAELVRASKGQAHKVKSGANRQGQTTAQIVMTVPLSTLDVLVHQFKKEGKRVIDWDQTPNTSVPENELSTAQIVVTLNGGAPIVGRDEGLGSYITSSLALSFRIFAYGVMFIIIGICAVLPWGLVIGGGIWLVRRMMTADASTPPVRTDKPAPSSDKPVNP